MSKAILVVDDETRPLQDLVEALEAQGYETTVIHGTDDAVAHFRSVNPELIFIHLGVPTAVQACEGVRDLPEGAIVPILFLASGSPNNSDPVQSASDALAKGGDFYFEQPLNLDRVLAKVQTYVGLPAAKPSSAPAPLSAKPPQAPAPLPDSAADTVPGAVSGLPEFNWGGTKKDENAPSLGGAADDLLAQIDGSTDSAADDRSDGDKSTVAMLSGLEPSTTPEPPAPEPLQEEEVTPADARPEPLVSEQSSDESFSIPGSDPELEPTPEPESGSLEPEDTSSKPKPSPDSTAGQPVSDHGSQAPLASSDGLDEGELFSSPPLPTAPLFSEVDKNQVDQDHAAPDDMGRLTTTSTEVGGIAKSKDTDRALQDELEEQRRLAREQTEAYAAKLAVERREAQEAEAQRDALEEKLRAQREAAAEEAERLKAKLQEETERMRAEMEERQATADAQQADAAAEKIRMEEELREKLRAEFDEQLAQEKRRAERERIETEAAARERAATEAAQQAKALADVEADRKRLAEEAAEQSKALADAEAERQRLADEQASQAKALADAEIERQRLADEQAVQAKALADAEIERQRLADEQERQQQAHAEVLAKEQRKVERERAAADEAKRAAQSPRSRRRTTAEEPLVTPIETALLEEGTEDAGRDTDAIAVHKAQNDESVSAAPLPAPADTFHEQFDIAQWLGTVVNEQATCRVDFESDKRRVRIYFERGAPVAAESDQIFDRMEEYLYREGKITRTQYNDVRMKKLQGSRRIGAYLVTEGALKPQELFSAVRGHLREIFYGLFELQRGRATRVDTLKGLSEDARVKLEIHIEALLLEGVRRKYLLPRLMDRIGAPSTLVAPTNNNKNAAVDSTTLGLHGEEARIVRIVDGTRSIEDMVFSTGLRAETVYVILHTLIALGRAHVAIRGIEGLNADGSSSVDHIDAERIRDKLEQVSKLDYFQILGVNNDATPYEIERAFERCEREFDQGRFSEAVRRMFHAQLLEINRVLEDAREVLADEGIRDAYARNLPA